MKQLDTVLLDLNRMRCSTLLCSEYQEALDKVLRMQEAENEHERHLAEIEAQRPEPLPPPPPVTVITYTEQDGLRIEHPRREYFTIGQRFKLAMFRWAAVILLLMIMLKSCNV